MDTKKKGDLLKFYESNDDEVGDLARWFRSPQRRYFRHEFFGDEVASLETDAGRIKLRDLGYGGCGLIATPDVGIDRLGEEFVGQLECLGKSMPFVFARRHEQKSHIGLEFLDQSDDHRRFLREFIQYMDAGLLVQQAHPNNVFPAYRGDDWLNLAALREAVRFSIRLVPGTQMIEANLVYTSDGKHIYCSWEGDQLSIGALNGDDPTASEITELKRQIVSILVGVRQGASLPNFGPVIQMVLAQ